MLWRHPAVQLLLIVLALGVAGMHTIGHQNEHDGHSSMPGSQSHNAQTHHGDREVVSIPTGDVNPSVMCLAILTATALLSLALSAAKQRIRTSAVRWRPRLRTVLRSTRAPPASTPTSLAGAKITVLRI